MIDPAVVLRLRGAALVIFALAALGGLLRHRDERETTRRWALGWLALALAFWAAAGIDLGVTPRRTLLALLNDGCFLTAASLLTLRARAGITGPSLPHRFAFWPWLLVAGVGAAGVWLWRRSEVALSVVTIVSLAYALRVNADLVRPGRILAAYGALALEVAILPLYLLDHPLGVLVRESASTVVAIVLGVSFLDLAFAEAGTWPARPPRYLRKADAIVLYLAEKAFLIGTFDAPLARGVICEDLRRADAEPALAPEASAPTQPLAAAESESARSVVPAELQERAWRDFPGRHVFFARGDAIADDEDFDRAWREVVRLQRERGPFASLHVAPRGQQRRRPALYLRRVRRS